MSNENMLNNPVQSMLTKFMESYDIQSIEVNKNLNFNHNKAVSDILVNSRSGSDGEAKDYSVRFKLQEQGADTYQFLRQIGPGQQIQLGEQGELLEPKDRDQMIKDFLALIKVRVEKAKQEQDVQSIRFVGNTFVLNKATTFRVLSDDGDGRLNIEILSGEGLQEAMLSAHGLLDGLYTGFIELVES